MDEPFISLTTFISSIVSSQVGDMITDFLDNFLEFFESMVSKTMRANSALESIGQLIFSGSWTEITLTELRWFILDQQYLFCNVGSPRKPLASTQEALKNSHEVSKYEAHSKLIWKPLELPRNSPGTPPELPQVLPPRNSTLGTPPRNSPPGTPARNSPPGSPPRNSPEITFENIYHEIISLHNDWGKWQLSSPFKWSCFKNQ